MTVKREDRFDNSIKIIFENFKENYCHPSLSMHFCLLYSYLIISSYLCHKCNNGVIKCNLYFI